MSDIVCPICNTVIKGKHAKCVEKNDVCPYCARTMHEYAHDHYGPHSL